MLNKIRNAADNIVFRIVLLLIVVAFGVWGVKDMLGSGNNFSVVTFNNADPIRYDEFYKARMLEIRHLQTMSNIVLSEEDIKQYGIDDNVISRLVTERLSGQLVKGYDIDFSDDLLISMIKQIPSFQGENGKFDRALFKATAGHFGLTEDQYVAEIKKDQSQRILFNTLVTGYYVPKAVENNIIDYLSEERTIDVVSIDLNSPKYVVLDTPNKEQLEKFYKDNPELFTLAEKRTIDYIIINDDSVKKLASVTEDEMKQYFEDNQDDFAGSDFNAAKGKIEKILQERRTSELVTELVQNLQDEISAGSSISEIAQKFEFKIHNLKDVTASEIVDMTDIGSLVDSIFRAEEGDVSYPLELNLPKNMAIFYVQKVSPSRVQDFAEVEEAVLKQWQMSEYNLRNLRVMEDFVAKTSAEDFVTKSAELKLSLRNNVRFRRDDIDNNTKFPPEMLNAVFTARIGEIKGVYNDGDKAFAMVVRKVSHSEATKKHVIKNDSKKIIADLKRGLLDELLLYVNKKENTKKNSRFASTQDQLE